MPMCLVMKKIFIVILSVFMTEVSAEDQWVNFVTESHEYLSERQNQLMSDYKLSKHKRWDWDQPTSSLIFSNDCVTAVVAEVQFVGSVSKKSGTWLWSWANDSIVDNAKSQLAVVRKYGENHDFPALTESKWGLIHSSGDLV